MENNDRARQFMPFDALKGFKEKIKEKERIVVDKKELSEDDKDELSFKLNQVTTGILIDIVYYDKEEYISLKGMVSKIDLDNRYLKIVKTKIDFDDIILLKGNDIKEKEVY